MNCNTNANFSVPNKSSYTINPFQVFDIVGPQAQSSGNAYGGAIGDCSTDSFSVSTKGYTGTPHICGINTGQHSIYMNYLSYLNIVISLLYLHNCN